MYVCEREKEAGRRIGEAQTVLLQRKGDPMQSRFSTNSHAEKLKNLSNYIGLNFISLFFANSFLDLETRLLI